MAAMYCMMYLLASVFPAPLSPITEKINTTIAQHWQQSSTSAHHNISHLFISCIKKLKVLAELWGAITSHCLQQEWAYTHVYWIYDHKINIHRDKLCVYQRKDIIYANNNNFNVTVLFENNVFISVSTPIMYFSKSCNTTVETYSVRSKSLVFKKFLK